MYEITHLYKFGDFLIALNKKPSILVWDTTSFELLKEIQLQDTFTPSCFLHPDTYINKIVIGSKEGRLQLWNINSGRLIYEFLNLEKNIQINIMQQTPSADIIILGYMNGNASLFNLKTDEVTMTYKQSGSITAITYRQDDENHPIMATGNNQGEIVLWDLKVTKFSK